MKTFLAFAVVCCLFVAASAQIPDVSCGTDAARFASCITQITAGTSSACANCASDLRDYYNRCTGGTGVSTVDARECNTL